MDKNKSKQVIQVYDTIATQFDTARNKSLIEQTYLQLFLQYIPLKGQVLDLGCGTGRPILQFLREHQLHVTPVDGSSSMLDIAKKHFPNQEFILQDMRSLNLNQLFDGIIAWHSLFHLSREDQQSVFKLLSKHLKQGGILLFTSGNENSERWGENYGEWLYHASFSPFKYRELLTKNGFRVIIHHTEDPNCGFATVWAAIKL